MTVGVSSLVIGFYLGTGYKLLSHKSETDESEWESDSEPEAEVGEKNLNTPRSREECKMVLVVRQDLKMEKGKIAAQCGHATLAAYKYTKAKQPDLLHQWERRGQAKVVVKAPSEEVFNQVMKDARAQGISVQAIQDAGRTQVKPGSRTVLAIGPAPVSQVDAITRHLKLL